MLTTTSEGFNILFKKTGNAFLTIKLNRVEKGEGRKTHSHSLNPDRAMQFVLKNDADHLLIEFADLILTTRKPHLDMVALFDTREEAQDQLTKAAVKSDLGGPEVDPDEWEVIPLQQAEQMQDAEWGTSETARN